MKLRYQIAATATLWVVLLVTFSLSMAMLGEAWDWVRHINVDFWETFWRVLVSLCFPISIILHIFVGILGSIAIEEFK